MRLKWSCCRILRFMFVQCLCELVCANKDLLFRFYLLSAPYIKDQRIAVFFHTNFSFLREKKAEGKLYSWIECRHSTLVPHWMQFWRMSLSIEMKHFFLYTMNCDDGFSRSENKKLRVEREIKHDEKYGEAMRMSSCAMRSHQFSIEHVPFNKT